MIRIEPQQPNFLELKPQKVQFKLPPVENYLELLNMEYLQPNVTYESIHYNLECFIVATGNIMYQDFIKGTDSKTFYIVKATKGFYFMLTLAEIDNYLIKVKKTVCCLAC